MGGRLIVRWAGEAPGSGYETFLAGQWASLPLEELGAALEDRRVVYWNPTLEPAGVVQ